MNTEIAFWDTSAILPLCCSQIFTSQSKKRLRKYPKIVIWWGTSVELKSGLARLKRDEHLTEKEMIKAARLWEKLRKTCRIISPVERVLELANDLPENYGLRALDSFQLAAALVWCQEKPRRRPFVTADKRLAEAAEKVGFTEILLT
ncbi:MAG: type II toxin-antitoxin system VapC family toxin [Acidobacteriota bacterium]|nr:type II toxin-antitoxin system VapC family toxin [Acidobacteriota bacterium]